MSVTQNYDTESHTLHRLWIQCASVFYHQTFAWLVILCFSYCYWNWLNKPELSFKSTCPPCTHLAVPLSPNRPLRAWQDGDLAEHDYCLHHSLISRFCLAKLRPPPSLTPLSSPSRLVPPPFRRSEPLSGSGWLVLRPSLRSPWPPDWPPTSTTHTNTHAVKKATGI